MRFFPGTIYLKHVSLLGMMLACALLLTGCETVEGTGRGHLILTSAAEEDKMGADAYKDVLTKEKRCTDPETIALVERVGKRLAAAAPDHGFKYEFTVLESPTINAFCLPGGKVAVYTGILPYCQNEASLACVMGHEIGHAIARHGGERMSQGMIVGGLSSGIDAVLKEQGVSPTTEKISMTAFGLGTQVGVMLPYSRKHESEADYLGLIYMAKAGYDPREAPEFWKRFSTLGSGTPAFLSTHPASEDRANDLQAKLKEAIKLYDASPKFGAGDLVPERFRTQLPVKTEAPAEPKPEVKETKKKKKK